MTIAKYYSREESSLSVAWARAFLGIANPAREFRPFLLSLTGFADEGPEEDGAFRRALDDALTDSDFQGIDTVANTIFPSSIWRRAKGDRSRLYGDYLEYLPDYVAMDRRKNRSGLYFARLIGYDVDPKTGGQEPHLSTEPFKGSGNQLEFIIENCKSGTRRSMFQAALYDPVRDQSRAAQQAFPCLQHLTFVPDFSRETLALNAFYATQQLFLKAYGNWLGLSRLGLFVAGETGLRFERMNCFAGIEKMDKRPKTGPALDRLRLLAESLVEKE